MDSSYRKFTTIVFETIYRQLIDFHREFTIKQLFSRNVNTTFIKNLTLRCYNNYFEHTY